MENRHFLTLHEWAKAGNIPQRTAQDMAKNEEIPGLGKRGRRYIVWNRIGVPTAQMQIQARDRCSQGDHAWLADDAYGLVYKAEIIHSVLSDVVSRECPFCPEIEQKILTYALP